MPAPRLRQHAIKSPWFIAPILLALISIATPARAYFGPSTHASASLVLGQADFLHNAFATTQDGMHGPFNVAVDPTTQKVFVADTSNNRVLRFASISALTNGASAEAVLGQPHYGNSTAATTQAGMRQPGSVFVDAGGRLWVADTYNNRVLRFDGASLKVNGANADGVLGQADFISGFYGGGSTHMWMPFDARTDAAGRLWVADAYNNRVLRFNNAASDANGAAADGVLGQSSFSSSLPATSRNGMHLPYGVFVDTSGRLWIADAQNNRVLRFNAAGSKPNGANADGVLGQPDFTSDIPAASRTGLSFPTGVGVDDLTGRLYVADLQNSRVMGYNSPATMANGANASFVLGQPTFKSGGINTGGLSAASMYYPWGVFFDPATRILWVSDTNNNRVLQFGTPGSLFETTSVAANDGWVLESGAKTNVGGATLATGLLRLGDNIANKQYRSVLDFDTSGLPDNGITIRAARLRIRKAGVVGADPLKSFGLLLADMKNGSFGTEALQSKDFQAPASKAAVGHFVATGGGWYQLTLPSTAFANIDLTGVTQFRVRFGIQDNANNAADFDKFFAGDALNAANRPQLVVEYTIP